MSSSRALLIYTGLRVSPLCSIKLGDISYAPSAIRVLVKGSKIQVVKMHRGLAELVKAYSVANTDLKGQTFLLAYYPGHHSHRRDIERMTARWRERAGVAGCTPHRFRHTFATRLLRTTKNLRVQTALAHSDVSDTALYTLVTNEEEAGAISELDFGGWDEGALLRQASETSARPKNPPRNYLKLESASEKACKPGYGPSSSFLKLNEGLSRGLVERVGRGCSPGQLGRG